MVDSRFEEKPELMMPANIPEDIFDIIYLQSFSLIHAMAGHQDVKGLEIGFISNIVSDILRMHDIYDMYKENISGLVVMYASWIILEALRRDKTIEMTPVGFDTLFDNELLTQKLMTHNEAFQRKISIEVIREHK